MKRRVVLCWLLLSPVVLAGCSGDDNGNSDVQCEEGLTPIGGLCMPDFAECQADEVPLLGGTCKKVGVEECEGGIKGPPDWTCKRIGVEECEGGIKGPPAHPGCRCWVNTVPVIVE